jgi:1-acyl-sn-glycerol-3-phosphate acyltransferase
LRRPPARGIQALKSLLKNLRASLVFLMIVLSTLLHGAVLLPSSLLKLLTPEGPVRDAVRAWLTRVAESWIGFNNFLLSLDRSTRWEVDVPEGLDHGGCYLVLCNHQSWVDILVLQRCFNRRLPLLRFFLKRQLIWVPVLGLCWWALDFPFMRRASREELARRPELRGRDLESARAACEKFQHVPVAMMSFPEGTRRRGAKANADGDHGHLLAPKAGGLGQVIYALGERLDGCVDVTVAYRMPEHGADPDHGGEPPGFWGLLRGDIGEIRVRARLRSIPEDLLGKNFTEDLEARGRLQDWLGGIWAEKDALLVELKSG